MVGLNVLSVAVDGILLTAMSILPEAPIPPLLRRPASLLDMMSTYRACWKCCLKFLCLSGSLRCEMSIGERICRDRGV